MQSQPSERAAVVATIDPANHNNSTVNSDYVDLSKFHEAMFILQLGAVDNTVDFKLRESRDTSGTGEQDMTGKAITQLTGTDDNKVAIINVKANELTAQPNPYRYVRASATVGNGTTNIISCVGLGMRPRIGPGSDDDLADVAQIIT
jgi:hypothetical protein